MAGFVLVVDSIRLVGFVQGLGATHSGREHSVILAAMPRPIRIRINYDLCQACPACTAIKACKLRAIVQPDPGEPPYLDIERCRDCSLCVDFCSFAAIELLGGSLPSAQAKYL